MGLLDQAKGLINLINKKPLLVDAVEIPKGPIRVHVQGETWRKNQSSSLELNTPILFSLTPKCSYQIKKGWPNGEYFNVNTYPSIETASKNWLGYVSYDGKPTATQIAGLVDSGKIVSCWGEYEIEDDEINIVITIPKKL